jgi:hypothetical protein
MLCSSIIRTILDKKNLFDQFLVNLKHPNIQSELRDIQQESLI